MGVDLLHAQPEVEKQILILWFFDTHLYVENRLYQFIY